MLPVLPGPVLLAEMEAPSEIVTDCPAVRVMFPPAPESDAVPTVRLKTPTGEPSVRVPDIVIAFAAWIVISPPRAVLLVPLLIWEPLPRINDPVVIEIRPGGPQASTQGTSPTAVRVKMPLGWMVPI